MLSRRELIRSIGGLPGIAAVRVEEPLAAGDIVVVECQEKVSDEARAYLCASVRRSLSDGVKVVVCDDGLKMHFLRRTSDGHLIDARARSESQKAHA